MITERVIHCIVCKVYVGTIRDAKLMKGLTFVCPTCAESKIQKNSDITEDYGEAFKQMFGNNGFDAFLGDLFKKKP